MESSAIFVENMLTGLLGNFQSCPGVTRGKRGRELGRICFFSVTFTYLSRSSKVEGLQCSSAVDASFTAIFVMFTQPYHKWMFHNTFDCGSSPLVFIMQLFKVYLVYDTSIVEKWGLLTKRKNKSHQTIKSRIEVRSAKYLDRNLTCHRPPQWEVDDRQADTRRFLCLVLCSRL